MQIPKWNDAQLQVALKIWKNGRNLYLDFMKKYSLEQLNKVPHGFNNNLVWNIGHIIVAQQGLVYRGSGLPMHVRDELFEKYKSGTKPDEPVTSSDVDELEYLLNDLVQKTEEDFNKEIFQNYQERTTITGFHLGSIFDAVIFNNYHEGMHFGMMMSIRKFI